MSEFKVTKVETYHLEHECNEPGCVKVLRIRLETADPQVAQAQKDLTPPDTLDGWRNGYCPEHAAIR